PRVQPGEPCAFPPQTLLGPAAVRFVGEPVALIVAETPAEALDAADLVAVEYVPLPAVTTAAAARAPGALQLSPEVPGNVCLDWRMGDGTAVERAFAAAAHVVELTLDNHRIIMNPMEPRGGIGQYDRATGQSHRAPGRYTLHVSSQNIHSIRDAVARALGVAPNAVRLVAPDVGGG